MEKKCMIKYAHKHTHTYVTIRMPHSICDACGGGDQQQFLAHRMLTENKQQEKTNAKIAMIVAVCVYDFFLYLSANEIKRWKKMRIAMNLINVYLNNNYNNLHIGMQEI